MVTKVNCPKCSTTVTWDDSSPFRPFCSERCRLIDLGQWHGEEHRIEEKLSSSNVSEIDVEDIEALLQSQQSDYFKQ